MARRLLTIGLLLTAAAWCGRTAAKPPDLPLDNKDTLTPQDPFAPVEAAQPSQPNPFPQAAESAAPEMETSLFSQIRPSARRMMASCLLFGVNPLMIMTPTADYFDVDADDVPEVPAVFVPPEQLHVMPKELPSDDATQSVCPYMRQLQCTLSHGDAQADYDNAPDVLHNLQMLQQARALMQKAAELAASGRDGEATSVLEQARDLCPGSRIDEAVRQAAASLFIPIYCGSPTYDFGADEESEPPARTGESEREIVQKLAFPVSVKFHEVPLREVIDELRGWQDIDICVDQAALDAEEVSLDHPITLQVDDVSLRSALNLILKQVHLIYVVKDEVLQITTERGAGEFSRQGRIPHAITDVTETVKQPGDNSHDACKVLLQKCHAAMDAGRPQEAADLAARAYEIDPEQAAADPFVYKMHLAGDDEDPVEITPCLPPVDPDTPAALEQLYRESLKPAVGGGEEQEPPTAETHPVMFEFGFGLDGSVQMFGQLQRGGPIWHAFLNRFGLTVWSSPDGGADPVPAAQTPMDSDSDY